MEADTTIWQAPAVDEQDLFGWANLHGYMLESVQVNDYKCKHIRIFLDAQDMALLYAYFMKHKDVWSENIIYLYDAMLVQVYIVQEFIRNGESLGIYNYQIWYKNWKDKVSLKLSHRTHITGEIEF